jgi:hypothetical protein
VIGGAYSNAVEVSFIKHVDRNKESQWAVKAFAAFIAKYNSHIDSRNADPPPNTVLKEGLDKIVPDLFQHQAVNALELRLSATFPHHAKRNSANVRVSRMKAHPGKETLVNLPFPPLTTVISETSITFS